MTEHQLWITVMAASIVADTIATAVMDKNGQYFEGASFALANALTVLLYAPSIFLLGYALKQDSVSFVVTVGVWTGGVAVVNTIAGYTFLGSPFNWRSAMAIIGIVICVMVLTLSESPNEDSADIPAESTSSVAPSHNHS